jgi:hypothetical protein
MQSSYFGLYFFINFIEMASLDRSNRGVVRKDYQRLHNPPLNSFLNPINDTANNADPDADASNHCDMNAAINPALDLTNEDVPTLANAKALDAIDAKINFQPDIEFDSSQSINPFDSVSETLISRFAPRTQTPRSWVYQFIKVQPVEGVFYTLKSMTIQRPERRYWC